MGMAWFLLGGFFLVLPVLMVSASRRLVRAERAKEIRILDKLIEGSFLPLELLKERYGLQKKPDEQENHQASELKLASRIGYFISVAVFLFVLLVLYGLAGTLFFAELGADGSGYQLLDYLGISPDKVGLFAVCILIAFIGSYISQLRFLTRRLLNYDMWSSSFLRSTLVLISINAVAAVFVIMMIRGETGGLSAYLGGYSVILVAFVLGFYSFLGHEYLRDFVSRKFDPRYAQAKALGSDIPLTLLDGIDEGIRTRLEDLEIMTVQNLTCFNPLQLYVETPYRLFEVMDWIEQAQLLIMFGQADYEMLRNSGIRNLYDLAACIADERNADAIAEQIVEASLVDKGAFLRALVAERLKSPSVVRMTELREAINAKLEIGYDERDDDEGAEPGLAHAA